MENFDLKKYLAEGKLFEGIFDRKPKLYNVPSSLVTNISTLRDESTEYLRRMMINHGPIDTVKYDKSKD